MTRFEGRRFRFWGYLCFAPLIVLIAGCATTHYSRPSAVVPSTYKETPPGWTNAQPSDQLTRGKWWAIFGDPRLDALEEKISISNQTLMAALDQLIQARALVRLNRADYYPTITAGASVDAVRTSGNRPLASSSSQSRYKDLTIPTAAVAYEPDLFGRVRGSVEAARFNAEASADDLESLRLALQSELASDYFQAGTLDAEKALLLSDVSILEKALELTRARYQGGVASAVDVSQAEAQLEGTRAQAIDVDIARAQFEHAIAALTGEPASSFQLASNSWTTPPPSIPVGLPSQLLERRPDVASAERRVAAASAQVGVARALYFPLLTLSGQGGFESKAISTLFSGASGFASGGASALVTAFDVGRRRAVSDQAKAAYDQSIANYRQSVLTAIGEVEDNLAAVRILEQEAATQSAAVAASEKSLTLSTNRYKGGVASYLEVLTAQTTALANERNAIAILRRRMTATVGLIQALGGGWSGSSQPAPSVAPASE